MAADVRGQNALAKRCSNHDDIEMVAGLRIVHPVRATKQIGSAANPSPVRQRSGGTR
jgi:hypothetical protein